VIDPHAIFPFMAGFNPDLPLANFLKGIPAAGAVYLLANETGRPVQLLVVGNLRASLKRRLGEEDAALTRQINYRQVVRQVFWKRTDSPFEADAAYLEAARILFPDSYRGLLGFEPAIFVNVEPDALFPRYTKTTDLARGGEMIGPLADKHSAGRFIQRIEDAFDLCRYYNILQLAPRGKSCAYKEMGMCPAPCDGTISMDEYRQMVRQSLEAAVDPKASIALHKELMQKASANLEFEAAARAKNKVDRLGKLDTAEFKHVRRLEDFVYLSLQKGPREGQSKLFLIAGGQIQCAACLLNDPDESLCQWLKQSADELRARPLDTPAVERIGLTSHHLLAGKDRSGVFLHRDQWTAKNLAKARQQLSKQKIEEENPEEQVRRELNAL
jgi:excinuclease UvrABC nuclease subunit